MVHLKASLDSLEGAGVVRNEDAAGTFVAAISVLQNSINSFGFALMPGLQHDDGVNLLAQRSLGMPITAHCAVPTRREPRRGRAADRWSQVPGKLTHPHRIMAGWIEERQREREQGKR